MSQVVDDHAAVLRSYVPDLALRWPETDPPAVHTIEGTLVSADISGFTPLSERLSEHGTAGAEELADLLNTCFGAMIERAAEAGGDVIKFGGDALLLFFEDDAHAERACHTCLELRDIVDRPWATPSIPRVPLGISQGAHSGDFAFFRLDGPHEELLIVGPGVTETVGCESDASAGQILVSAATAGAVPASMLGPTANGRRLVQRPRRRLEQPESPPPRALDEAVDVAALLPATLVDQVVAGGYPGEHRQTTVGFVQFAGTDELVERGELTSLLDRLQRLADAIHDAIAETGAHWVASDVHPEGGKILLAAGAPLALGLNEDRAVRALRQILDVDCGLPLSGGVNRGGIYVGDLGTPRRRIYGTVGEAVALAARLMHKAGDGQLLASMAVLDRVPTPFALEPLAPFKVKGKREAVEAAYVGGQVDPHSLVEIERPKLPLVGRQYELDVLESALADARAGRGKVVEVAAEPGTGKTRLIQELVGRSPTIRSVRIAGGPYGRTTPHFALRRFLRTLAEVDPGEVGKVAGELLDAWVAAMAPELLPWLPLIAIAFDAEVPPTPEVEQLADAFRPARLRRAVADLVEAALAEPTIIVAEDTQWLDEESVEVMEELARRVPQQAWLLLVTRSSGPAVIDLGPKAQTIELSPLSDAETAQIVGMHADVTGADLDVRQRERLTERAGGHPLLALELVNGSATGLAEDIPDSVEALVTARIDGLDAADRVAIREAAVIGQMVDLTLLAGALREPELERPSRWAPLTTFLEIGPGANLRFRHALYHEVAYAGSSVRRRRQVHRMVGNWLEARYAHTGQDQVSLLSLHFDKAVVPDKSWRYSVEAGRIAQKQYANVHAAEFYRRAVRAVSAGHKVADDDLADVHEQLGDVLELDAQYPEAATAYAAARRKARPDSARWIALLRKQGVLRERQGQYTQALRWYGRGLSAAERLPVPARRSASTALALAYAGVRHRQGRQQECAKWAHRAAETAAADRDEAAQAHAYHLLATAYTYLGRAEAADYRGRALPIYEALGDLVGQANVLNNMGVFAYFEGEWDEALELYERARAAREKAGDVVGAAVAALNIGEILSDQGWLPEAQDLFRNALETFQSADYPVGAALALSNLGGAHVRAKDLAVGREMLDRARDELEALSAATLLCETRHHELQELLASGAAEDVLALATELLDTMRDTGQNPVVTAQLERYSGAALLALGRSPEAAPHLDAAVAKANDAGAAYELALALELRGSIPGEHSAEDRRRAGEILRKLGVRRAEL